MMKFCAGVLTLAIATVTTGVPARGAYAANEIEQAQVAAGKVWYEKYCTPCHGQGGAPGSAVYRESDRHVDLRTYVQRNNGIFPAYEWIAVVENVDLTAPHGDVWQAIRTAQQVGTTAQGAAGRGVVALIADYIISVQTK